MILNSYLGQYVTQAVFHSAIAVLVVEALLRLWRIQDPWLKLKFRLAVLILPIFGWPLYTLIYHQRANSDFGQETALIDFRRWLNLEMAGYTPLWYLFLLLIAVAILLFLVQELMPTLRHRLSIIDLLKAEPGRFLKLDSALAEIEWLSDTKPTVFLISETSPTIFSSGIAQGAIVLSPSLVETLDKEELVGVIAHELTHLRRRDHRLTWFLLILRALMFYNPVALFVARRLLQDNEMLSDDQAISITQKPLPLASGLLKVFGRREPAPNRGGWFSSWVVSLENQACRSMMTERVRRLTEGRETTDCSDYRLAVTLALLAVLLFFVV